MSLGSVNLQLGYPNFHFNTGVNIDLLALDGTAMTSKAYPALLVAKSAIGSGGVGYHYGVKIIGQMSAKRDAGGIEDLTLILEVSTTGAGSGYTTIKSIRYDVRNDDIFPLMIFGSYNITTPSAWFRLRVTDAPPTANLAYFSGVCAMDVDVITVYV